MSAIHTWTKLWQIVRAVEALLADVRARHPGEPLRCNYLATLDRLVSEL